MLGDPLVGDARSQQAGDRDDHRVGPVCDVLFGVPAVFYGRITDRGRVEAVGRLEKDDRIIADLIRSGLIQLRKLGGKNRTCAKESKKYQ